MAWDVVHYKYGAWYARPLSNMTVVTSGALLGLMRSTSLSRAGGEYARLCMWQVVKSKSHAVGADDCRRLKWKPSDHVWSCGKSVVCASVGAGDAQCLPGLPEKDLQKLKYALDMVEQADDGAPFAVSCALDPAVLEVGVMCSCILFGYQSAPCLTQAIEWQAVRTAEQVIREREEMISQLELAAAEIRSSGKHSQWLEGCKSDAIRGLSKDVNGFLFTELLMAVGYKDVDAVELFRNGKLCVLLCWPVLCPLVP